jgi:hypothetical protein
MWSSNAASHQEAMQLALAQWEPAFAKGAWAGANEEE